MGQFFSLLTAISFLFFLFCLAWTFGCFRKIRSLFARLLPFALALFFLLAFCVSGMVTWSLRSYRQFHQETLVAVIRCEQPLEKGADFTLLYTPVTHRNRDTKTRAFQIRGGEWTFGGAILRWKGWLRFFGARTLYRPLWIAGGFRDRIVENPTFYSLKEGIDPLWFLLERFGGALPFVEASHGSSVWSRPEHGIQFHLYATPTGFSLKKVTTRFRDVS